MIIIKFYFINRKTRMIGDQYLSAQDLNDNSMFYNRNLLRILKEQDIEKIKVKIFEKIKIIS